MAHAKLNASTSKRWIMCPGSIALIDSIPADQLPKSSRFAMEGTAAHALLEACLRPAAHPNNGAPLDAESFRGRFIKVFEDGATSILKKGGKIKKGDEPAHFEITQDMCDAVQVAIDEVVSILDEQGAGAELHIETKIQPFGDDEKDMFGTTDIAISQWPDWLIVLDYKHGAGVVVETIDNPQVKYYALGFARKEEFTHRNVKTGIIQPRAPHSDGAVRFDNPMGMRDLIAWGDELKVHAEKTRKPNAPLNAGDWCRFCPASGICPELKRKAQEIAGADFDSEPLELHPPSEAKPSGAAEIARLVRWVPMLDAFCRGVTAHEQRMLERGVPIPGRKLVRRKTNRKWLNEEEAAEKLREAGVPSDKLFKTKLQTPKQVEGSKVKGIKDLVRELAHNPQGALTVADEDDPRESVVPDPANDFADVPLEDASE